MSEQNIPVRVLNSQGEEVGTKEVSARVFAAKTASGLLHQVVRWQRAKKRAGTHSTKTRAEVSGGGIKPWKQKGTGRARSGSNTSPLWVRGGTAHGPKPRSYEFDLNKKERKQALCSAVSVRSAEGKLFVAQDLGLDKISTRRASLALRNLGIENKSSILCVINPGSLFEERSLRNINGVKVVTPDGLNVYDVIRAKYLLFLGDSLERTNERLSS